MVGMSIETNMIDDGVKDHITEQFPGYAKLAVYQTDRRIIWILPVKASEMEHSGYEDQIGCSRRLP